MLGSLGLPEILFILVIALLVFGPKRLPQVGRTLGRALGEFRRATTDLRRTIHQEIDVDLDEPPPSRDSTEGGATSEAGEGAATARQPADDSHRD